LTLTLTFHIHSIFKYPLEMHYSEYEKKGNEHIWAIVQDQMK
jgi:hypothetical protein